MTTYDKAEILSGLWHVLLYGTDKQRSFAQSFNISFPLGWAIGGGIVEPHDIGIKMIDRLWSEACELLGVDANADYAGYQDFEAKAKF